MGEHRRARWKWPADIMLALEPGFGGRHGKRAGQISYLRPLRWSPVSDTQPGPLQPLGNTTELMDTLSPDSRNLKKMGLGGLVG